MSKATKRKHVTKEVLDEYILPEGDQLIVKVQNSRGNNLHEVQLPNGETVLASMPTKFRKNVWIKKGDFVIVCPIAEGDKVKVEISHILFKDQIKYIQEEGLWPVEFSECRDRVCDNMIPDDMLPPSDNESDDDDEHSGDDLPANPNRQRVYFEEDDSSEESDEENDDDKVDEEHGSSPGETVR